MNLLAHIYLSGSQDRVKIGNFIGDYVKGRKYRRYPPLIKKGILMHRSIDSYTDHNPVPVEVRSILRPYYRKYAGIVVDLFYDHFLANDWHHYASCSLRDFVDRFYKLLDVHFSLLPPAVQNFVPRMIENDRIYSYSNMAGIEKALQVMAEYTSLPCKTDKAMQVLSDHYGLIYSNFSKFFPGIISYVAARYDVDLAYFNLRGHP
jgi:acyl carrier protein phosphodiesterase